MVLPKISEIFLGEGHEIGLLWWQLQTARLALPASSITSPILSVVPGLAESCHENRLSIGTSQDPMVDPHIPKTKERYSPLETATYHIVGHDLII